MGQCNDSVFENKCAKAKRFETNFYLSLPRILGLYGISHLGYVVFENKYAKPKRFETNFYLSLPGILGLHISHPHLG